MERAVIYLKDRKEYINILADKMESKDDTLYIYYNGALSAVFALSEVKAAYLSIKDFKKI